MAERVASETAPKRPNRLSQNRAPEPADFCAVFDSVSCFVGKRIRPDANVKLLTYNDLLYSGLREFVQSICLFFEAATIIFCNFAFSNRQSSGSKRKQNRQEHPADAAISGNEKEVSGRDAAVSCG